MRLLVCTHAHSDHYGLAAPIVERAGCELWMHPRHEHMTRAMEDPERSLARRIEVARQSGVPLEPLRRWAEERRRDLKPSIAEAIEPHRELLPGVEVETDHGMWSVHYTPGHAPSHVVLFQPEQRLLLSGDHVLGRVFAVLRLRLDAGPGGGVPRRARGGRATRCAPVPTGPRPARSATCALTSRPTARRSTSGWTRSREAIAENGEATAFDLVRTVFGEVDGMMMSWALTIMLCFLSHLERAGRVEKVSSPDGQSPERWRSPAPTAVLP